ncbi:MAG TPA: exodeoxyribonuclease VII large subunit [Anaerolineales bacterium]|nr:exodeoxyribonuclease VII large subunit [Anaerolineales bacterium]
MALFQPSTWSVTDITRYLRDLLESEEYLQDLWVEGEVSNLSRPASGHLYFTLKDRNAALRCVMWRNQVEKLAFLPQDGDAIEIHGSISIYEASGNYQLYGDLIRPAGEGALYQEFLLLKAKLEAEGLFDPQRKRAIPPWPQTIGIITSPTGAALRDMHDTIQRRYPLVKLVLAPTQVQGDQATKGILSALEALNHLIKPDLILVARGGGSIEDLMAFNDEQVARAIADSTAPVITGIGHETDFTIADFAADLRAPTPTAAAELATPNQADLQASLRELSRELTSSTKSYLLEKRVGLERQHTRLHFRTPLTQVRRDQQRLDELNHRAGQALFYTVEIHRTRLAGLELRIHSLNPRAILKRGYSIVTHPDGTLVSSTRQVQTNDDLQVQVSDGAFPVRVQDTQKKE